MNYLFKKGDIVQVLNTPDIPNHLRGTKGISLYNPEEAKIGSNIYLYRIRIIDYDYKNKIKMDYTCVSPFGEYHLFYNYEIGYPKDEEYESLFI